jgi:hypothetical protein
MDFYTDIWPNKDAFEYVSLIWHQIEKDISSEIMKRLRSENPPIPLLEDILTFKPDWTSFEDWVIVTDTVTKYDQTGKNEIRETIREVTGKLHIVHGLFIKNPSFRFKLDVFNKKLSLRVSVIRDILSLTEEDILCNQEIIDEGVFGKPIVTNRGQSLLDQGTHRDVMAGFKTLGYKKEEALNLINLVTESNKYKDGMEAGEIVTLGLMMNKFK